jgi:hypothetical protein
LGLFKSVARGPQLFVPSEIGLKFFVEFAQNDQNLRDLRSGDEGKPPGKLSFR